MREVGLRDGLQSIFTILPTEPKLAWIRAAHAAGQRELEVGSFVPARLLPQLAAWLHGETLCDNIWRAGLPKTLLAGPTEAVAA